MTTQPPHTSGSWLRRFARVIFDDDTMTRVIDPTLADIDHEVREAGDDAVALRSARLRGYVAFWKLVVLSPFVFADWPGRRQFAQSLTHIGAIVILLAVTFGAQSPWMTRLLTGLFGLYPQIVEQIISAADLGPYVWLLTPIAVAVLAGLGRRSPFRAAPIAVLMICGATIAAAASYGAAGFLATFGRVGSQGSAGLAAVIPGVDALALLILLALGTAIATTLIVSVSLWRARGVTAPVVGPTNGVSGTAAVVLTLSMTVALVAVNRWLLMNETMIDFALDLTVPGRMAAAGGGRVLAARSEMVFPLMLLGLVIAVTTLATAFAAWRSRTRQPNPLLTWTTRLAVAALLAVCVWHTSVIHGQWQSFHTQIAALRAR